MPLPPDILALERSVHGVIAFAPSSTYPDGAELKYANGLGPRALIWALRTLKKHLRLLPPDQLDDFRTFYKKYDGATLFAVLDEAMRPLTALTLARINDWKSLRRVPGLDHLAPHGTDPSDWLIIGGVGTPSHLLTVYRGQPAASARPGALHRLTLSPSPEFDPQPAFASFGALLTDLAAAPADVLTLLGYALDPGGESTPVEVRPSFDPVKVNVTRRGR